MIFQRRLHSAQCPVPSPRLEHLKTTPFFRGNSVGARAERYDICQDLVNQLVAYAEQKRLESDTAVSKLVTQVLSQVHKKRFGWNLSPAEANWISNRVRVHFEVRE